MEKVTKYRCDGCGKLFNTPEQCLAHEIRHEKIQKANKMLEEGYTLKEIQDECDIWESMPEHLKDVTTNNCFTISYLQSCSKPAYKITDIYFNGNVFIYGCGSWEGYYGKQLSLDANELKDPRPNKELFVNEEFLKMKNLK